MMNLFLSYYQRDETLDFIVQELEDRGFIVRTNFERLNGEDVAWKTDRRLKRIRSCDAFIFFAEPEGVPRSIIRQNELGYALGREKAIAFVGEPQNSLHKWGDVFDDIDDFLDQWYPIREREAAVA
jgi:hypothetical protein